MEEGEKGPGARGPPGEEPLPFPAWEEGSGDENVLVIHSQVEEEEEAAPFKCPVCGESFGQQPGLLRHQKQHHAGERTFVCAECGKGFGLKHNLIIHQRIHTGEKPFSCGACGKRFSLKQNLLTHQRVHAGAPARPLACPACGKSFQEQRLLRAHQKGGCGGHPGKEKRGGPAHPQLRPRGRPQAGERLAPRAPRAEAPEKPHPNGARWKGKESGVCTDGPASPPHARPTEGPRQSEEGRRQSDAPGSPTLRLRPEEAAFECQRCGQSFAQKGLLASHWQSHRGHGMLS